MFILRRLSITLLTLALLGAASGMVASAQDEGPPMPPPGDPFAGMLSGTVSFEPLEAPTEECPFGVRTITDAVGSTTIGEVSLHSEHCTTPGMPTAPSGLMTLTTGTGDRISGPYFVDCDPILPTAPAGEIVTCPGRFMFASGTGAFGEVSGTAYLTANVWFPGSLEFQQWPWIQVMHGSIDY